MLNKALKSSLKAGQLKKNESHLIISNYKAHYYHKILVSDMKIKLVRKRYLLLMAAVLLHYSLSKGAEDSDRLHTGQCQLHVHLYCLELSHNDSCPYHTGPHSRAWSAALPTTQAGTDKAVVLRSHTSRKNLTRRK